MDIDEKLSILADAAKYDASCASSGGKTRDSLGTGGVGLAAARARRVVLRRVGEDRKLARKVHRAVHCILIQ